MCLVFGEGGILYETFEREHLKRNLAVGAVLSVKDLHD